MIVRLIILFFLVRFLLQALRPSVRRFNRLLGINTSRKRKAREELYRRSQEVLQERIKERGEKKLSSSSGSSGSSAKEEKKEFEQKQAALDAEFLVGQLDVLYNEYRDIQEDLEILEGKIEISKAMHEVDNLKRHFTEKSRLNKKLMTVSGRIHSTEKRLRTAQFKAGQQINC